MSCYLRAAILCGLITTLGACDSPPTDVTGPEVAVRPSVALASVTFRQISAGVQHACGVTTDRVGYCWGILAGYSGPQRFPQLVGGGLIFHTIAAGFSFSCGVTIENRAFCWGINTFGQLGDGTQDEHATPLPVHGGLSFRQVSAGHVHACGVTTDDRAYCWGTNGAGVLGDGTTSDHFAPVAVVGNLRFRMVSAGAGHTCGLTTDGRAFCWGSNRYGQLGDSSTARQRLRPALVAGAHQFRQLDAGGGHTCAVTTSDRA